MHYWVREGILARSPRPGYSAGEELTVHRDAVIEWTENVRELGIASIICILGEDQLPLYKFALPDGLIEYYREVGFEVCHVSTPDGRSKPLSREQLEHIWSSFLELPKPVLIHCSAGHDRTGIAVDHILSRLQD